MKRFLCAASALALVSSPVLAIGVGTPYFATTTADALTVYGTSTLGPVFEGTGAAGDYGYAWNGEFRQDQNAATTLGAVNATSGASAAVSFLQIGGTTNSSMALILADNSGSPVENMTFGSAVTALQTNIPYFSPEVANAGNLGSVLLPWGVVYVANAVLSPTSTTDSATLTINAPNDTNGANIKMIGNGSTTPNKYISTIGGAFQIVNSGYTSPIFTLDDLGDITTPSGATLSAGTVNASSYQIAGNMIASATNPTWSSGACAGNIGTALDTAAFTFNTGVGSCGSTATITMPVAAHGWVCDAVDENSGAAFRIQETADTTASVTFTGYSIGASPAATNFTVSHVVKVMCSAY